MTPPTPNISNQVLLLPRGCCHVASSPPRPVPIHTPTHSYTPPPRPPPALLQTVDVSKAMQRIADRAAEVVASAKTGASDGPVVVTANRRVPSQSQVSAQPTAGEGCTV